MGNPNVAGKKHRAHMQANYNRLELIAVEMEGFIDSIEVQHQDFYRVLLEELEHSDAPEDFEAYQRIDRQYTRRMASLQAARERIIEATTHLKAAVANPGDPIAHLKNVTQDSF